MKKFKQMLAGLVCVLALCALTPAAFAARVTIYYEANGGICDTAAAMTNESGKLTSLPTPTLAGYNFDGWYIAGTDDVTGAETDVKVKANSTVFKKDATVYAHWTANGKSTEIQLDGQPSDDPEQLLQVAGLCAGSVLTVLVVSLLL